MRPELSLLSVLTVACAVIAVPLGGAAQGPSGVPVVGVLSPQPATESAAVQRQPFEAGLRDLGWSPGADILIDYRYAEGEPDRLPALAAELVRRKVDVIVARGAQAIRAAREASETIPIVMSFAPDPVGQGFAASLARPGGNVTGLSFLAGTSLEAKRLELLREALPNARRVALLANPASGRHEEPEAPGPEPFFPVESYLRIAAESLDVEIKHFPASTPSELFEALAAIGEAEIDALFVRADPNVLEPNRAEIVAFAEAYRLPAMYPWRLYTDAGGLMSYSASIAAMHYRSATYVDAILKGVNPADLPIEQPSRFELVINLNTAKTLGITIPPALLARADEVIE